MRYLAVSYSLQNVSVHSFQYASVLDETPASLGGRENSWRLLTLEGSCR